eukprot:1825901-Rhodomonas_salina.3
MRPVEVSLLTTVASEARPRLSLARNELEHACLSGSRALFPAKQQSRGEQGLSPFPLKLINRDAHRDTRLSKELVQRITSRQPLPRLP